MLARKISRQLIARRPPADFPGDVGPRRSRPRLLSVTVARGTVNLAKAGEAEAIRRGMIRRCRGYAVEFAADGEALSLLAKEDHETTIGPAERSIASASKTA